MSRHRNVRNISLEDELYDDFYGRSLDENDFCVSPATEAEFMFRRDNKVHTLSSFMEAETKIEEEPERYEDEEDDVGFDEEDYKKPQLDSVTNAKLQECKEKLEDVIGEAFHEKLVIEAIMNNNYNCELALDQLLKRGCFVGITIFGFSYRIPCT